jgi:hypothetical protein
MLRLGLVGWTVTPPSVFGCDCVAGGGFVDGGGGAEEAGVQTACGGALCGGAVAASVDDNALGVDNPVDGDPVAEGDDGVGAGAAVEP